MAETYEELIHDSDTICEYCFPEEDPGADSFEHFLRSIDISPLSSAEQLEIDSVVARFVRELGRKKFVALSERQYRKKYITFVILRRTNPKLREPDMHADVQAYLRARIDGFSGYSGEIVYYLQSVFGWND